jgi:DNA repair photolyase
LRKIENIFAGESGKFNDNIRAALKYHDKKNGYPCPVQVGAINDPCDNIEKKEKWLLKFMKLCIKYNQPARISTKGNLLKEKKYLDALSEAPHLFWIAFSIISIDDEVLSKIDRGAPPPSERLDTMKQLSNIGCSTSLRFRPIIPGVSDATKKHPVAYRELIEKAKVAGAKAISYEVMFWPNAISKEQRKHFEQIENIASVPLGAVYERFGKSTCQRPSYTWTENIMHAIKEEAVKNNMNVGVSDAVWKQLTDCGCCCGIGPGDKVFGNWERENATNIFIEAQKDKNYIARLSDIMPKWASDVKLSEMVNLGTGPLVVYKKKYAMWSEHVKKCFYDLKSPRGMYQYFQGAWEPVKFEGGELGYKYVGLKRRNVDNRYWSVSGYRPDYKKRNIG